MDRQKRATDEENLLWANPCDYSDNVSSYSNNVIKSMSLLQIMLLWVLLLCFVAKASHIYYSIIGILQSVQEVRMSQDQKYNL